MEQTKYLLHSSQNSDSLFTLSQKTVGLLKRITLLHCIREAPSSNLGRDTGIYSEIVHQN